MHDRSARTSECLLDMHHCQDFAATDPVVRGSCDDKCTYVMDGGYAEINRVKGADLDMYSLTTGKRRVDRGLE